MDIQFKCCRDLLFASLWLDLKARWPKETPFPFCALNAQSSKFVVVSADPPALNSEIVLK